MKQYAYPYAEKQDLRSEFDHLSAKIEELYSEVWKERRWLHQRFQAYLIRGGEREEEIEGILQETS